MICPLRELRKYGNFHARARTHTYIVI